MDAEVNANRQVGAGAIAQSHNTSDEPDPELNSLKLNSALEPYKVAVEVDANAPEADKNVNHLELEAASEPETGPGLSETALPSEPVNDAAPDNETELLSRMK